VKICRSSEVEDSCIYSDTDPRGFDEHKPVILHLLSQLKLGMDLTKVASLCTRTHTHTHTHPFNGHLSRTTRVGRYQKGKTNLDFTEARDSEWQWHHLGHMQVCTSLQADNHASTRPLCFLQAGCRPTSSVKALEAKARQGSLTTRVV